MMRRAATAILLAGLCAPGLARAEAPRAIVELFTSQSCSSCPPADKLLAEIASEPGVLVLSFPVDYWDYVGWKDTLAERSFTARQKAYGESRGDRQVYTPQAVIDGFRHAVGSDRVAIFKIVKEGGSRGALTVPVTVHDSGAMISVSLPASPRPLAGPATVLFFPVIRHIEVAIGRGENKGKTVAYTNVVRELVPLGPWDGAPQTYQVPASIAKLRGADSWVVVVQEGPPERPGLILGASRGPGL